ncbi:MAG: SCP2 sterol-binding domain-containing protein [Chloroflexi bacterium]|nr:SCP2 sterol-binding domain-containing protein [Chloroflexota bacterium]
MAAFESKEQLYDVWNKMGAILAADEAFKKRIANANASMGIIVPELGAEYTIYFEKGTLRGAEGGADKATIAITLSGDTLDKLFSGKLDGESAYMYGYLKLRGDEWTAQTMAGYLWNIRTAYQQAKGGN